MPPGSSRRRPPPAWLHLQPRDGGRPNMHDTRGGLVRGSRLVRRVHALGLDAGHGAALPIALRPSTERPRGSIAASGPDQLLDAPTGQANTQAPHETGVAL